MRKFLQSEEAWTMRHY